MPSFVKPPWIDKGGWDEGLKRQTVHVNHYATVGLTLDSGGQTLIVTSNNPSVAKVEEQPQKGGLRIFRVTGLNVASSGIDYSMLEAKNSTGTVQAFMQIQVIGPAGKKKISIFLATQKLQAFEGATKKFEFDCVTSASDYPTVPGTFHISRKDRVHRSAKYNAQMNFAMFFSADGKAIHQYHGIAPLSLVRTLKSGVSDWFGSHGCVRLSEDDARALFDWTLIGTTVEIR
jgi:lipoprotein-anchoring transpeptidase ErfK/SrfK